MNININLIQFYFNNQIQKQRMRLMRPLSSNKQNVEQVSSSNQCSQKNEMKRQLKQAYAQIHLLKKSNQQLVSKVQIQEKQLLSVNLMKQEITFLKEQDQQLRQKLLQFQQVNNQLKAQLDLCEKDSLRFKRDSQNEIKNQQFDSRNTARKFYNPLEGQPLTTRTPINRGTLNTSMNEKSRTNHSSTPKSKVNISWDQFMPGSKPDARRVFL